MKKMKYFSKRGLALFIALLMCVSMLPVSALAAEGDTTDPSVEPSQCTCETKCTAGESNLNCPVCSAESVDLEEACTGKETEEPGETEEPEEPLTRSNEWDKETGTLTIIGTGKDVESEIVTKTDVSQYKNELAHLNISKVALIDKDAFAEFKKLETVTITEVGTIGYAFRSTSVKEVTIDTVDTIETYAFYNPANLTKVSISNVKNVGNEIFSVYQNQTSLTDVSLKNIDVGYQMFKDHKKLVNLTLENVGTIGFQAFMNCTSLNLNALDSSQVKALGISAFLGCTGLTELTLDDVEIGNTVFYGCTGLTNVTLKNIDTVGQQAFTGCTSLTSAALKNIGTIGEYAFSIYGNNVLPACTALTTVTMDNVGTIGKNAFASCTALETVNMTDVDTIDNFAFWNCSSLTTIDSLSNVKSRIGGFAFYGCKSLTGLTVADLTKMGYIGGDGKVSDEVLERVEKILAGSFKLDNAETIEELTLEGGWTAGAVAKSEGWTNTNYKNATQLMQQARWQNGNPTTAEVKMSAHYTGEKQMDYIFVADLSASMAQLGNPDDNNARFYDMQSKLLDMTGKLLNTNGYDCQVAIVTFGGYVNDKNPGSAKPMQFTSDATAVQDYIKGLEPLNENTDYVLGLNEVLEVMKNHESNRNTVVVFLSDGAPTMFGKDKLTDANARDYQNKLTSIKKELAEVNVPVYGVLHSPAGNGENAKAWMKVVCDEVYASTDTDSFGEAMNKAFSAAYPTNTVTIPVNADDFDVVVPANEGAEYDAENGVITWTVGMPFTKNTLTYTMKLKDELANRIGTYSYKINKDNATFGGSGASVGVDLTLSRTVSNPTPPTPVNPNPPTTQYTVVWEDGDGNVIKTATTTSTNVPASLYPADPEKEDAIFLGWSDPFRDGTTITITAEWEEDIGGEPDVPLVVAPGLDTQNHLAYINGYGGQLVKPENNITRAEVATIFYRLMEDSFRGTYWTNVNGFVDVDAEDWFNNAVSTSADAELIKGYGDGTFKGNKAITRAEFATIAARFIPDIEGNVEDYPDTADHWAAQEIRVVTEAGWFTGDNRGFRPNDLITRAEAMTVVNRMVNRVPGGEEDLLDGMVTWEDNLPGAWYYEAVQEATNSHNFEHGQRGDETKETWTELIPNPDWKALEKEWEAEYLSK